MTAVAPNDERLRELGDETRRAWAAYSASLRGLHGDAYERVEDQSWLDLQRELRRLETRRALIRTSV